MKRILLAITILLLVPAVRQARADASMSVDFFYNNIGSDGNWVELADYGYCWQPAVAVSNARWRPYTDGYWAYTNVGWAWVSYEDFGWATYHYGRWARLRDRGWFWVPGRQWAPAWVSWRMGGDYVGWAPLPPRGADDFVDDHSPITGQVDLAYDIGPDYYNFIDVRYIGEPVLRERIVEPGENVTYIGNTVNVTNITYVNSRVYDYGADYNMVNRYSSRPIQQMTVELTPNVDPNNAVKTKQVVKVQGDRIMVASPQVLQKPSSPVAPKTVKEKIEKPTVDRGWKQIADPKKEAELKQKMKAEDPKKAPPPNIPPRQNAEPTQKAGASGTPVAPAKGATPAAATPANTVRPLGTAAPAASAQPALTPAKGKDKRANASPMATVGTQPQHEKGVKKDKGTEKAAEGMPPERQPNEPTTERETRKSKAEPRKAPSSRETAPEREPKGVPPSERVAPANQGAGQEAHGKHQTQSQKVAPPPQAPPGNVPPKSEAPQHKRGGEKKGNEPAPTPR